MGWDSEERFQLERALGTLDEATSTFERLVDSKDRAELFDELGKLNLPNLRRILLACVLAEQQRRRDRPDAD
jgi:hypothetical protein